MYSWGQRFLDTWGFSYKIDTFKKVFGDKKVEEFDDLYFKGLISGNVDFEAQGRDSTFTFLHSLLKKAILLHKRAIGP